MATPAPRSFRERYGPWALVAGGSLGLGLEFARQLAERGLHLVLVAESPEPLEARAVELARRHGVEVRPVVADCGAPELLDVLAPALSDLEIGLLVCNAAHSAVAPFLASPLEDKLAMLHVNCRGPLLLCHALAPAMVGRGRGGIVLLSSLAGLQGSALVATYAATKAFDLVLGEGLWEELRHHGVDVLAVCPGATRTPGWEASGAHPGAGPAVMEPGPVVREALAALGRGPLAVPGRANRVASWLLRHLASRPRAVRLMGSAMRGRYPDRDPGTRPQKV